MDGNGPEQETQRSVETSTKHKPVRGTERKIWALPGLAAGLGLVILGFGLIRGSGGYEAQALVRCNWGHTNEPTHGGYGGPDITTDLELIRSEAVLDRALDTLKAKAGWTGKSTAAEDRALLKGRLSLRQAGLTNVIVIAATGKDATEPAAIANAVAEAYAGFRQEQWMGECSSLSNACAGELQKLNPQIATNEDRLKQLNSEMDADAASAALSATNDQAEAEAQLVSGERLLTSLNSLSARERRTVVPTVLPDPAMQSLVNDLTRAKVELTRLQAERSGSDAETVRQQELVGRLEQQAQIRADQLLAAMSRRVESLRLQIADAKAKADAARRAAADRAVKANEAADIDRELEGLRRNRDQLQSRISQAAESAKLPQVEAVQKAGQANTRPSTRRTGAWAVLVGGAALGIWSLLLLMGIQPAQLSADR